MWIKRTITISQLRVAIIIGFFCLLTNGSYAQQLPMQSLNPWTQYYINPAFSSLKDTSSVLLSYRQQWTGFAASPKTIRFSGFTNLGENNGVSASVTRDKTGGAYSQLQLQVGYGRRVKLMEDVSIAFGLSALINQYTFDNSIMELNQNDDPVFNGGLMRSFSPDAAFGVVLEYNRLQIGISGHQLFESPIRDITPDPSNANKLDGHYYFSTAYRIQIVEDWEFEPYLLIKRIEVGEPQYEILIRANYRSTFGFGLSYRQEEAPGMFVSFTKDKIILNYLYDVPASTLKNYSSGSHEVLLGFAF